MNITLFPDQRQWCRAVVDAFEKPLAEPDGTTGHAGPFTRVMGIAATGAGKTIMAGAITEYAIRRWRQPGTDDGPSRVLFLADTDELVQQAQEKIYAVTGRPAAREKASDRASLDAQIVVGSFQTLQSAERRGRFPANHFSLVVVDEAHGSMANTWQATMNHFHAGGANLLGITATPERGDDRDLWKWWEHKAAEIGLFDLIAMKRLAPIRVKTVPLVIHCEGVKAKRNGDLNEDQLREAIEPTFSAIIDAWEAHGESRKTLWFLPGVKASLHFADMLVERGHAARHIDGGSPDRRQILAGYAENRFTHLCNAQLLTKGYDCPDIACVVNLAPTGSRVTYQQRVGRGTRTAPGKTDLLLLDFLWQFDRLGIARPVDLVARNEREADRMQRQIEQQARQSDRGLNEPLESLDLHDQRDLSDSEIVKALIRGLIENTTRKTRTYDASAAAALINAPELLNYEPKTKWERSKPTPRQLELLAGKGIARGTIKTRGEAAAFLDTLYDRQRQGLATFKQAARLTAAGVPDAALMTFQEAGAAMDRLVKTGSAL